MKMTSRVFRTVVMLALIAAAAAESSAQSAAKEKDWDDSFYAAFTPETFAKYAPAQKPLDFKNVDHELLSAAIFFETNALRAKNDKKPLLHSLALRVAAFGHARDMAEKDFNSHENPDDPEKKTLVQRLALVGIERCRMSENIASMPGRQYPIISMKPGVGQIQVTPGKTPDPYTYLGFAKLVLEGWTVSPGHKENILADGTPYVGCAAYPCTKELLDARGQKITLDYFRACQDFASKLGPGPKARPKGEK